jgi:histidinol phosphatase-like PHP family hydrolase
VACHASEQYRAIFATKGKLMLIDMHAHSSGISTCCQIPYDKVIDTAKENGMDGIVLTNHYQKNPNYYLNHQTHY